MDLRLTDHLGLAHFTVAGPIEAYEAAMMTETIGEQIVKRRSGLVLEFTGNGFVSATIIGLLIALQRLARCYGGEIVIVRPPRLLCRNLRLLESGSVFRRLPSVDAAAAALRGATTDLAVPRA